MLRLLPSPTGSSLWARVLLLSILLIVLPAGTAAALAWGQAHGAPAGCRICISQVYGHGGKSGSPYNADFIELFNRSGAAQPLGGWRLDYADVHSEDWRTVDLGALTLPPHGYGLIALKGGATGAPLPPADITGNLNLGGSAGKVQLVDGENTLVDLLGYGDAEWAEGAPAAGAGNGEALLRADGGCTDSDDNAADFVPEPPQPRNSQAPAHSCGDDEPPTATATFLTDRDSHP